MKNVRSILGLGSLCRRRVATGGDPTLIVT